MHMTFGEDLITMQNPPRMLEPFTPREKADLDFSRYSFILF